MNELFGDAVSMMDSESQGDHVEESEDNSAQVRWSKNQLNQAAYDPHMFEEGTSQEEFFSDEFGYKNSYAEPEKRLDDGGR